MPLLPEPPRLRDSAETLLPPNSTALERDMVSLAAFDAILRPAAARIPTFKDFDRPTDWMAALLLSEGMSQLSVVQSDPNVLLDIAYRFNRHKGTPWAILEVCRWAGFPLAELWEHEWESVHFAEFQIALGALPSDMLILGKLYDAVNYTKPLRGRFRRVYYGHDRRKLILSNNVGKETCRFGGMLSDFSGIDCTGLDLFTVQAGFPQPRLRVSVRRKHQGYELPWTATFGTPTMMQRHTRIYDPDWDIENDG